jgi:hypothetical protein
MEKIISAENSMSVPDWVEFVNKLATPSIGGLSAFYISLQYVRAQRWKANDLAAALIGKLSSDSVLSLTCHALDWGRGPLLIPEQYQSLFPREGSGHYPGVMQHDTKVMAEALEPKLNLPTLNDPKGLVYRHCFIRLFTHLDTIYSLLKSKQLRMADIGDLGYWLDCLSDYKYAPSTTDGKNVFQPALKAWGYDNVILLMNEFDFARGKVEV